MLIMEGLPFLYLNKYSKPNPACGNVMAIKFKQNAMTEDIFM